jgi:hypothetical protein
MRYVRDRVLSHRAFVLAGTLTAAFALWVELEVGGERTTLYLDDLATPAASAAAAVLCARAARRHTGRRRLFWRLVAAPCAAWTAGEVLWAVYDLGSGEVPVPSWADAGYLAALPLAAAALLVHPALRGRATGRTRSLLDGLVIATAVFLLGWTLVFEPVHADLTTLGGLVTFAYPLGDVAILFLVVLVIRGTTHGDRLDLWCLLAGLLAITGSDAVYTYLTDVGVFSSGNLVDAGWFAGYLAIALGALCSRPAAAAERPEQAALLTTAAIVAPFLPMLAALGLVAVRVPLGHRLDRMTLGAAFVLAGLVLARQALLLFDLLFPRCEDGEAGVADRLVSSLGVAAKPPSAQVQP